MHVWWVINSFPHSVSTGMDGQKVLQSHLLDELLLSF